MNAAGSNFQQHSLTLNGQTLFYRRGGPRESGRPSLLYLHGTDGLAHWPEILDDLAQHYDVIAPDHPGFGQSEIPGWMDDVSDLAYLYLGMIDELQLGRVHISAHSLGGWIALEMAVRSQSAIASLALMAPAGIHVKGQQKTDIFMIDPDEQARLAYADADMGAAAADVALAEKYQDIAIGDRIASARFGWNPRFYNPRLGRWLHRIKCPSLIIWGTEDRIFPPAYGPAFQALMPGSELLMMAQCGHLPHVERRAQTLAALCEFFDR